MAPLYRISPQLVAISGPIAMMPDPVPWPA
jgi:hypothetical protein